MEGKSLGGKKSKQKEEKEEEEAGRRGRREELVLRLPCLVLALRLEEKSSVEEQRRNIEGE